VFGAVWIALHQVGMVTGRQEGLAMTSDSMDRDHLILELGDIQEKLARLAERPENAKAYSHELRAIGDRIRRLMDGIQIPDGQTKAGPEDKVILVVDDNDELREFVKQALELSNYNVLDTPDGEETLALLKEVRTLDLILCDVILPGMKGPDLVKKVRDMFPDLKSIFMSGYVTEDIVNHDVEQILATGGLFLQKPFPTRKLLEAVYNMLGV
jgi:CheY-like chemotaxis protein